MYPMNLAVSVSISVFARATLRKYLLLTRASFTFAFTSDKKMALDSAKRDALDVCIVLQEQRVICDVHYLSKVCDPFYVSLRATITANSETILFFFPLIHAPKLSLCVANSCG